MASNWDDELTQVLNRTTLYLPTCALAGPFGTFNFTHTPVRIGKDPNNDFQLRDSSCSRFHALLQQTPSGFLVRDLDSTNGVTVAGVRVREAWLEPGVTLRFGDETVVFQAGNQEHHLVPSTRQQLGDMVGQSEAMRRVFDLVERVAPTGATVLILGETGTGKEVLAHTLHAMSRRARGRFAVVDCSTIPEALIESELFGHEKGAFTGALAVRRGLFEEADGGTLFLDEIGELPLSVQPKLLRVLETGEFRRVGGTRPQHTDVRIVAATNRNLFAEADAGRFRKDLLYRLHVVTVRLPSLRQRMDDLPLLAHTLLARIRQKSWGAGVTTLAPSFLQQLRSWSFPGNVRELANILEREVALADGPVLEQLRMPLGMEAMEEDEASLLWSEGGSRLGTNLGTNLGTEACYDGHAGGARLGTESFADGHAGGSRLGTEAFADGHAGGAGWEARSTPGSAAGTSPALDDGELAAYRVAKEETLAEFHKAYLARLMRLSKGSISAASRRSGMERKAIRQLLRDLHLESLARNSQE